jgi:hypothetical protein
MTDINPTAIAEERYPKTSKITPRTATLLSLRAGQIQGYSTCIRERELPLRERVAELEDALRNLVRRCPRSLSCDDFSHDKNTYHAWEEPCNPYLWYKAALSRAEEILQPPMP